MYAWCMLYLASLYGLQLTVVGPVFWEGMTFSLELAGVVALLSLVLGGVGIGLAVAGLCRAQQKPVLARRLRRVAILLKLLTIPFFCIHLLSWAMVSAAFLVVPGLQVLLLADFLGVAFAYWVLLTGSAYSLSAIWMASREGRLGHKGLILWGISQFIFVVDVPAYFVFLVQTAKGRKQAKEVP